MSYAIERAAVLGSGVMGSALAAHLANAGIPTLLLDIVPPAGSTVKGDPASREYRDAFARTGLERALKAKPAPFFSAGRARRVSIGNLEDDVARLGECDWILEAVVEKLDVKRTLFEKIAPHLKDTAIVSTNTSGLSITDMAAALPAALRPRFLGTHFFNPPRYLHLLELIPHAGTDPAVLEFMREFGDAMLGKGVVIAKDSPDFIANRIGTFAVMSAIRAMIDGGYTVEEVDALTGPLLGRPKSATFRTVDLVGLDIMVHASTTVYDRATKDEKRDYFKAPELLTKMLSGGMLGDKSGKGFYQKVRGADGKSEIHTLDTGTLSYRAKQSAKFGSLEAAKTVDDIGERVRGMIGGKDRAAAFAWKTLSETFLYAAARVGEIADDVASIDRAMRWGFGWEKGPFELWDAVGVEKTVERMRSEGMAIPSIVDDVLKTPSKSFYQRDDQARVSQFQRGAFKEVEPPPATIDLARLKAQGRVVKKNAGASLVDLGDGVLCLEFHSKMNAIGADILSMVMAGVKETETNFEALVVGNQGTNFSVGANIMLLLLEAREGNWDEIDLAVRQFQKATSTLKYCRKPVVAAPFGMALGGGCEMVLGAQHVVASAETYIGLVEVGVGLIPAGGGCKEMVMRNLDGMPNVDGVDVFPFVRAAFETIGLAKVSTSAEEAFAMRFLRDGDSFVMNADRLLHAAKTSALALARRGYQPPDRTREIPVAGEGGIAAIKASLYNMREGKYISDHDAHIGTQLGRVLCGGELPAGTKVTEDYLLALEREMFLKLCGEKKTQDRMAFMLKEGKPLPELMKLRALILVLAALVVPGCSKTPKPNVVLIVLDTLRGDRLSCLGYDRPTSPHIDALAAQGALYTHAFATCFWTLPSHASIFTGLHPLQAGATSETLHFPEENVTIAEALGAKGYRTAAFVCNSWVSRERGFAQGFTEFTEMWRHENQVSTDSTVTSMETLTVEKMEAWIAAAAKDGKPFFLFANLNGVHLPYRPSQEYLMKFVANRGHDIARVQQLAQITSGWSHLVGETPLSRKDYKILSDLYDAEVAWADALVGRVMASLDHAGVGDNTVVIVMSDHGEHLGEHGKTDHIATMYDPALHVPLVIRYPVAFKPGTRVDTAVSIVDVAPTVLQLCNAADQAPQLRAAETSLANPSRTSQGFVLAGNERPVTGIKLLQTRYPGYDYAAIDYRLRCLRSTDTKLIWNENRGAELYNLARDPGETLNLAETQAGTQRDMMSLLAKSFEKMGKSKEYFLFESTDREALERLRSLGYIH